MSIESRWQLLPGPRPLMGFQSDLGRASLSFSCGKCRDETKIMMEYRVKKEGPNKDRICYKCPDRNVSYLLYLMIVVSLYLFS